MRLVAVLLGRVVASTARRRLPARRRSPLPRANDDEHFFGFYEAEASVEILNDEHADRVGVFTIDDSYG